MRIKRLALVGASLVLVGGMTAACGSSPTDASEADFCDAWETFTAAGGDEDAVKDALDDLKDVGTPESISDDARDGFEFVIDNADDTDLDADDVDEDDQKNVSAFITYAMETCSDTPEIPEPDTE